MYDESDSYFECPSCGYALHVVAGTEDVEATCRREECDRHEQPLDELDRRVWIEHRAESDTAARLELEEEAEREAAEASATEATADADEPAPADE